MLLNELHTCPAETQSLVSPWRSNSSLVDCVTSWKERSGETKVSFWISFNFFYDGKFILSTGWIPFVWHCVILMKKFPEILETTGLGGNLPEKVVGERPHSAIRSLAPNSPGNLYREAAFQLIYSSFTFNTELLPLSKWGWTEPDGWRDGASRIFVPKTPKRSQTRSIFCPFVSIERVKTLFPGSAAGLAQSVERLTAEREVAGPSCGSDDHVKRRSRVPN